VVRFIYQLLKLFLRLISVLCKQVLGPYTFTDISLNCPAVTMTITTIDGIITTIHCKERRYLRRYANWYVRDRTVSTYTVYATVCGDVSENYNRACNTVHSFPKLLHPWMSADNHREAVVEAYIDILLCSLRVTNDT
jgi:hypothetical protein